MTHDAIDELALVMIDRKADILVDRRRPGRQDVDPALLPLFRGPVDEADTLEWGFEDPEDPTWVPVDIDPVAPAKGVALGILLSIPLWGFIGVAAYFAFR